MAALTLAKQDITDFVRNNFGTLRDNLFVMLKPHYQGTSDFEIELNGEESIAFVMLGEDFSVGFNVSMDDLYDQLSADSDMADAVTYDIQRGDYKEFFEDLAEATLYCVSYKEAMADDAPLYEQAAYTEIDDYDHKFDNLIENVVNPFREAVKAIVD